MGTDAVKKERQSLQPSSAHLCKCAVAAAAFLFLIMSCTLTTSHGKNPLSLRGATSTPDSPPLPYKYDTMIEWFKRQNWDQSNLPMKPELSWFDVDMALHGSKASWFKVFPQDRIDKVVAVTRQINRFHFMTRIMTTGKDFTQGSMPVHLLILLLLEPKISNQLVKVIDIGCGTGWLATAFAFLVAEGSHVYGLDCASMVADAQHFVGASSATEDGNHQHPEIVEGDWTVQQPPLPAVISQGLADAINFGFAVRGLDAPELHRAQLLLKPGGMVTVPIADAADESCRPGGSRCAAKLTLLQKVDGTLVPKSAGNPVKFFAGGSCKESLNRGSYGS